MGGNKSKKVDDRKGDLISPGHQMGVGAKRQYEIRIAAFNVKDVIIPGVEKAGEGKTVKLKVLMPGLHTYYPKGKEGSNLGTSGPVKCENGGGTGINWRYISNFEYDFVKNGYSGEGIKMIPTIKLILLTGGDEKIGECDINLLDVHQFRTNTWSDHKKCMNSCLIIIIIRWVMETIDTARKWIPFMGRRVKAKKLREKPNWVIESLIQTEGTGMCVGTWPLMQTRAEDYADTGPKARYNAHGFIVLNIQVIPYGLAQGHKVSSGAGDDKDPKNKDPKIPESKDRVSYIGAKIRDVKDKVVNFGSMLAGKAFCALLYPLIICLVAVMILLFFVSQLLNVAVPTLLRTIMPI